MILFQISSVFPVEKKNPYLHPSFSNLSLIWKACQAGPKPQLCSAVRSVHSALSIAKLCSASRGPWPGGLEQGSLYYQPKQCTIIREIPQFIIHLHCSIPAKWVPFNDPWVELSCTTNILEFPRGGGWDSGMLHGNGLQAGPPPFYGEILMRIQN